ncbi:hypothetical protein SAMN05192552_10697 [Natrinema hispanicum]|uniref:Uncharacterized protein n=1 Tax=Natrinema hispanicum TaxID=392421 RepID=A0A1G6YN61_9EURY|nr:hypothetical protein SAMN05192552_10697 [Natrinema hispanicum]
MFNQHPTEQTSCPNCERHGTIHTDKPWLPAVCLACGTLC